MTHRSGQAAGVAPIGSADRVVDAVQAWLEGAGARRHEAWQDFAAHPPATLSTFTHGVETLLAATVRGVRTRGWSAAV
ncbi:hypothetical protein [Actinoplanes sp. NPDC049118]|uniref:hypothetical protein n=1 Tax=Actinoplanes sp. NPDC049118 TaxID=3155769 RepID=UPI0033EC4BCA